MSDAAYKRKTTVTFWIVEVPEAEVEKAKADPPTYRARFQSQSRWMGKIGEWAFSEFLKENKVYFKDLTKDGPSWVDFKLGTLNVDVKTITTKYFPKEDYACNVDYQQHHDNHEADAYVFVRFIKPKRTCVIVGWCRKDYFTQNALTRMGGEKITKSFTPVEDFYEIKIDQLQDMQTLLTTIR